MNDVYDTVKHVYENPDQYGIDKTKIVLEGRSGGSFLALGASYLMI